MKKTSLRAKSGSSEDSKVGVRQDSRWVGLGWEVGCCLRLSAILRGRPDETHVWPEEKVHSSNQMCTSSGVGVFFRFSHSTPPS